MWSLFWSMIERIYLFIFDFIVVLYINFKLNLYICLLIDIFSCVWRVYFYCFLFFVLSKLFEVYVFKDDSF